MTDPTVELSAQDERDWQAERQEDITSICWQKCQGCNGRGFHVDHWEAYDQQDREGGEYILKVSCPYCEGQGHIQVHDPLFVEALYEAADDARERMGVGCYTRIVSALSLAICEAVSLAGALATVASATVPDKTYTITYPEGCDCYDAHYRALKIGGWPACKHQIAVWLVKAAEKKMAADELLIREEKDYDGSRSCPHEGNQNRLPGGHAQFRQCGL